MSDLVVKATKTRLGVVQRILIDDHRVMTLGTRVHVSSDGKTFHRRTKPGAGIWYDLIAVDGVVYGSCLASTKDFGTTWQQRPQTDWGAKHTIFRDAKRRWWQGREGDTATAKQFDKTWKDAFKIPGDKVLDMLEIDGRMFVAGTGSGFWNGTKFTAAKTLRGKTLTRVRIAPSGALIAHGDAGVAFRSIDRGKTWKPVRTGTKEDLEDSAWIGDALIVVGGKGVMLCSTNDGETFTKLASGSKAKLWAIASWGTGALFAGDDGIVRSLAPANDTYWRDAKDTFAPAPITIDPKFRAIGARSVADREKDHARLHAEAVELHAERSARLKRPVDANPELARAIDEGHDDALGVYADWLNDQGDSRGELAQIQIRLEKDPKHKQLRATEKTLFKQYAEQFLGKLAPVRDLVKLEWRAGFIRKARLANDLTRTPEPNLTEILGWLLAEPSARFMRELVLGVMSSDENEYGKAVVLIGKRSLPSLHRLVIGDFDSGESEISWADLGSLDSMYAALPNLRELELRAGNGELGTIVLPNLEKFSIVTVGLSRKSARSIATAVWPSLTSLSIQVGPAENRVAKLEDFRPIFTGATLPRLEELRIANCEFTSELLAPLAVSPLLPQLDTLGLEMGTMGDEGAATMFRMQRAFEHLTSIDVDDNYLTSAGKALLTRTGLTFDFGKQRDDDDDRRYASAYE